MGPGLMPSCILRGINNLLKSELLETGFSSTESVVSFISSGASVSRRPRNPSMFPEGSIGAKDRTADMPELISSHTACVNKEVHTPNEKFSSKNRRQILRGETRKRMPAKTAYTFGTSVPVGEETTRKALSSNAHREDILKNDRDGRPCIRAAHTFDNSDRFGDTCVRQPPFLNDDRDYLLRHNSKAKLSTTTADTFKTFGPIGGGSVRKQSFVNENKEHLLRNEMNARTNTNTTNKFQNSGVTGDISAKQLLFVDEDQDLLLKNKTDAGPDTKTGYALTESGLGRGGSIRSPSFFHENQDNLLRNEMNARTNTNVAYMFERPDSVGCCRPAQKSLFVNEHQDDLLRLETNARPVSKTAYTFAKSGLVGDASVGKSFFFAENQYHMQRNNTNARRWGNPHAFVSSRPIGDGATPQSLFCNGNQQHMLRDESTARTGIETTSKLKQRGIFGGHVSYGESCFVDDHNHHCPRGKERKSRTHAKTPYSSERSSPTGDIPVLEFPLHGAPNSHLTRIDMAKTRDVRTSSFSQRPCSVGSTSVVEPSVTNRNSAYQTGHTSRIARMCAQTSRNTNVSGHAGDGCVTPSPRQPGGCLQKRNKRARRNSQVKNNRLIPYHTEQRRTTRRSQSFPVYHRFWRQWEDYVTKEVCSSDCVCKSHQGSDDAVLKSGQLLYDGQTCVNVVAKKREQSPSCNRTEGEQLITWDQPLGASDLLMYDAAEGLPADMWNVTEDRREVPTAIKQASSMQTRERHKTWPKGGKVCFVEEKPRGKPNEYKIVDYESNVSSDSYCAEEYEAIVPEKTPSQTSRTAERKMLKFIETVRESPFNCRPSRTDVNAEPETENTPFPKCASYQHESTTYHTGRSRVGDGSRNRSNRSHHSLNNKMMKERDHSPYACSPLLSNTDDQNTPYRESSNNCHPIHLREGDELFKRRSPFNSQQTSRRNDETAGIEQTSPYQYNLPFAKAHKTTMNSTPWSPRGTEKTCAARTQSLQQQPYYAWLDEDGRVAKEREVPFRHRQTWVREEANLDFRHSSPSQMSRSSHQSVATALDDDHADFRRKLSLQSLPFRPDEPADSPSTATKCHPVDEETVQHKQTHESPERQKKKQSEHKTQPESTTSPQTPTPKNEEHAHKQEPPKHWPWDEQVVGPKRPCIAPNTRPNPAPTNDKLPGTEEKAAPSGNGESGSSQDIGKESAEHMGPDEFAQQETDYRKRMADRAKEQLDVLFDGPKARETTLKLILHHMDTDATINVFIGCMEFFWKQLGNMLTGDE